jgi:predicted aspartyl protease
MAHWTGSLDNSGSPKISIRVHGFDAAHFKDFEAIIDTGFTGFLSMPIVDAFPLGLILGGTTATILADGSTSPKLMALGTATVLGERQVGTILLNLGSGPSSVLLGMEFLKAFKKTLFVHGNEVVLLDYDFVKEAIDRAAESVKNAAAANASGKTSDSQG